MAVLPSLSLLGCLDSTLAQQTGLLTVTLFCEAATARLFLVVGTSGTAQDGDTSP
ncbi:hypothetical protein [Streptomyces sp. A0642]|uniref:hypothetical protein n=1 Tax=Streptomyces sp. A0642 TaxID=2563100 RepID=UPI001447A109|nr:hypothetical protein [Streptomyces sp. A0642]